MKSGSHSAMVIGLRHWAHSGAHNLSRKQERVIRDLRLSTAPLGPSISLTSTRKLVRECVSLVCGPLRGAYGGLGLGGAALSRVQRRNVLVGQSFDHNKFQVERFLTQFKQGRLVGNHRAVQSVSIARGSRRCRQSARPGSDRSQSSQRSVNGVGVVGHGAINAAASLCK